MLNSLIRENANAIVTSDDSYMHSELQKYKGTICMLCCYVVYFVGHFLYEMCMNLPVAYIFVIETHDAQI